MSTNASSFRRILRSIGSHATPPTSTLRTSSASVHPPIPRCRRYSAHAPQHNKESHATTEDVPIQKIEQEPPSWQVGGPGKSVQHIGSRHSSTPSQPIKHSDLSEPKVAESHLSRRQPFEPKVRDENTFRKQYFETVKSENKTRLKESARRRQLSAERHLYPEDKAWADIWKVLEKNSSSDATSYVKRMETIRWPKGIFAKWSGDPAEAILEVMQRTGSHVQVVPGKRPGLFSSITLLGTPSENAAATKLLRESDLLRAVSHDDPNASTSLAEYQLSSEVSTVKTRPDDEGTKIPTSDRTDERGSAHIQKLMSDITGVVPTRAVWSRDPRPVEEQDIELSEHEGQDDLLASKSALPISAVAFTRRIEKLTERQPRQFGSTDNESVKEQLVALMTNPNLAIFITPAALRATMRYFTANGFYPAARVVLNALKDAKVHIDADVFNVLLHAAAKDVNVLAFHYIVHIMRDRGVLMNAGTWVAFHTLTLKRFPEDAGKVVSQMTAKSVQASAEAKSDIPESYAATFLDSFLDRRPAASMIDFFEHMKREVSSTRWLTTFSANTMCAILLKRGKTFAAFEVVDELVRRGGRPDTVTLNTFLSAAKRAGDMEMAVALLRKFHDLHAKSIALACKEDEKPTIGSRKHDLSVNLNRISYKMLFTIAWQQRNYNCLRVFWRYACCAGLVDPLIRQNMDQSAAFDGHDTDGTLGPHARIRLVCASRFAMGVRAGLDDAQAAKVLSAARGVRHVSNTTPLASVQGLLSKAKPLSERGGPKKRLAIIAVDESEVGKLRPTRPLVELAEQALRKDRSWKDAMLGNPNAQDKYGSAEEMLEVMLKTGIQVPMKEGKLRRLSL